MIPVVCSRSPGSCLRSNTRTRKPRRASTVAHAKPAKLAPTIVQSTAVELEGLVKTEPDGMAVQCETAGTRLIRTPDFDVWFARGLLTEPVPTGALGSRVAGFLYGRRFPIGKRACTPDTSSTFKAPS